MEPETQLEIGRQGFRNWGLGRDEGIRNAMRAIVPIMKWLILVLLVFLTSSWGQTLSQGSILPLRLNSSLNSGKAKLGQTITARVMQDIPHSKVREGAKVIGHVLSVKRARNAQKAELTFRFDVVCASKHCFPMNTNLRALAAMMEVEAAQIPPSGPDRGTPWEWATRNLIGGEVAYGQGGPVARGTDTVGRAVADGVLVRVEQNSARGCRGEIDGNAELQALWVFSSDACGIYGYPNLTISHSGRTAPVGEIKISSNENINIRSGSGMLLRVN